MGFPSPIARQINQQSIRNFIAAVEDMHTNKRGDYKVRYSLFKKLCLRTSLTVAPVPPPIMPCQYEDRTPSYPPCNQTGPPPEVIFTVSEQCFVNKKCHFTINFYGMNSPHFFDIPSYTTNPFLPNQSPFRLVCIDSEGYDDY